MSCIQSELQNAELRSGTSHRPAVMKRNNWVSAPERVGSVVRNSFGLWKDVGLGGTEI